MNRRKFLSSAVALAVAPAIPKSAAAFNESFAISVETFQVFEGAISVQYINGKFSGTISRVNKGGK